MAGSSKRVDIVSYVVSRSAVIPLVKPAVATSDPGEYLSMKTESKMQKAGQLLFHFNFSLQELKEAHRGTDFLELSH